MPVDFQHGMPQETDLSVIYDLKDEPAKSRPARYMLSTANNMAVYAESEEMIALAQQVWRVLNGFHPETGEAGYCEEYVINHVETMVRLLGFVKYAHGQPVMPPSGSEDQEWWYHKNAPDGDWFESAQEAFDSLRK